MTKHPPYLHDGSVTTLREVVELYNRGGDKNPYLDVKMEPLRLSPAEVDAIVAFLRVARGRGLSGQGAGGVSSVTVGGRQYAVGGAADRLPPTATAYCLLLAIHAASGLL